ncbi:PREDICTED: protein PDF [Bactrocera latifrons]|uniref:protein PDF n=1 Tax=Bactrocera latifrons TaxID=174628 RepID=UPI0008DE82BB|nr:PREDICTED: protein PDF [Bactrocera latifrons]
MVKLICLVFTLIFCTVLFSSQALPTPDEERYMEKDYNREFLNWLNSIQYPQPYATPCKYYPINSLTGPVPKRNSELINSLLSLPKSMNEAGK